MPTVTGQHVCRICPCPTPHKAGGGLEETRPHPNTAQTGLMKFGKSVYRNLFYVAQTVQNDEILECLSMQVFVASRAMLSQRKLTHLELQGRSYTGSSFVDCEVSL